MSKKGAILLINNLTLLEISNKLINLFDISNKVRLLMSNIAPFLLILSHKVRLYPPF